VTRAGPDRRHRSRLAPRRAGRTFVPALVTLVVAGGVLFVSEATWLRLTMALLLLGGIFLGVRAIATPDFVAADADEERE
jgi:hypothetical protein